MNDKGRVALSSLAISVSVASILGVSRAAYADPPPGYCNVGPSCTLGWTPDVGYWFGGPQIYDEYEGGWVIVGGEGEIQSGGPVELEGNAGHFDYGSCGFDESSPPACGCGGFTHQDVYVGVPYLGWYTYISPDYRVPNWDPPYSGVDWTYYDTYDAPVFHAVFSDEFAAGACWIPED